MAYNPLYGLRRGRPFVSEETNSKLREATKYRMVLCAHGTYRKVENTPHIMKRRKESP